MTLGADYRSAGRHRRLREAGAGTVLRRLDPERLATWLENYQLGDLWRMGELGANP